MNVANGKLTYVFHPGICSEAVEHYIDDVVFEEGLTVHVDYNIEAESIDDLEFGSFSNGFSAEVLEIEIYTKNEQKITSLMLKKDPRMFDDIWQESMEKVLNFHQDQSYDMAL
jgi:hypothetical protein